MITFMMLVELLSLLTLNATHDLTLAVQVPVDLCSLCCSDFSQGSLSKTGETQLGKTVHS